MALNQALIQIILMALQVQTFWVFNDVELLNLLIF